MKMAHEECAPPSYSYLTRREAEIFDLIFKELSSVEIANLLDIRPMTVENHTSNIYTKTGVSLRQWLIKHKEECDG